MDCPRKSFCPVLSVFCRASIVFATLFSATSAAHADEGTLTFEQHIRPIFRAHCFDCHGATEEVHGGLDLRQVRLLIKGGDSGPALSLENAAESQLLERIRSGEMPPGEKKVTPAELETLERWIAQGAKTARPEPETIPPGLGITQEERDFWSFRPITPPDVPELNSFAPSLRVRTPIDALMVMHPSAIDSANAAAGFAPDADRRALVVRAYFDLLGLPPTPEELARWMQSTDDGWYDQLLTELLASPHYGERWGRHWLDVAGYADSDGATVNDTMRPWAWKYRDWVVAAFNSDKPFDQFIKEQLAGDELAGRQHGDWMPEQIALLTATGFLRMAADGTGSGANTPEGRNQVMADTLKIVGTSLLGLSLQCAQCHDHRYDPIPQTDYFAIRAVFEPALDWQAWQVPDARRISLYTEADRQKASEIEVEAKAIADERAAKQAEYMQQALDMELMKFEEPLRAQLREAYETPADKRSDEQKQLLMANPSVNISPGVLYQYLPKAAEDLKEYDKRINEVRGKKPVEEFLQALVEPPNHRPETKLFYRGDFQQPKQMVAPAGLTVAAPDGQPPVIPLDDPSRDTTGRRLAFARWLTDAENPLFSRVMVNRIWMHHFGVGLVNTPADFGRLGARPTQPELLDWLATEFRDSGWSLKHLHRLIMSSTAWRQQRGTQSQQVASVFPVSLRRLEAETLRDRMLAASGQLDRSVGGSPVGIKEDDTGQVVVDGAQTRRSMYVQVRRSRPVAMLQAFDAPVMETNCESRSFSTVATQSLMLLNGEFILNQAAQLADRAAKEAQPVSDSVRQLIPSLPLPTTELWAYGFGSVNEAEGKTASFTPLTHWTGSRWQAGPNLPDSQFGWVLLDASGGHPDQAERGVIRRWIAPQAGLLALQGELSHGSENGDGVRGRVVSNRQGILGDWVAQHNKLATNITPCNVEAGEVIDLVVDCRQSHTSDTFNWPVTLTLSPPGESARTFASVSEFRGPQESLETLAGQIVRAWQLAYSREPSNDELKLALNFVAVQMPTLVKPPENRSASRQALTNLCQALLSSNEFLYIE
ncbi:DUF1553 domain-containing protein [bacterium]|nr:DUF1553 domain-containing protein [bacterium]